MTLRTPQNRRKYAHKIAGRTRVTRVFACTDSGCALAWTDVFESELAWRFEESAVSTAGKLPR